MSDIKPDRNSFCPSCGKSRTSEAAFCEKCGKAFGALSPEAVTANDPARIETSLHRFRFRLTATCPYCNYRGMMGWNDFHFPMSKAVWIPLALGLCLLGIIPGLIVFLLVQRGKRYQAECPNCQKTLLLKMSEAQPIKSAWGGAQFFDVKGQMVADSRILARAGKWVLIGAIGIVGLLVVFGTAGMLIGKAGWKVPSVQTPSANDSANLSRYSGKMPDQAFWTELRPLFSGTILPGGHNGSEVFGDFYDNQTMYAFTPCQYDATTQTITVTWKSKNPEPTEEGCVNCQFLGSHAVSVDVSKPEHGIVAHLSISSDNPSIEFISKDMPSIDADRVKTQNFGSLPPALASWAQAFIAETHHSVEVEMTDLSPEPTHHPARSAPADDKYVTTVRNGVLSAPYNTATVGKAFEATFADWKWESKESEKGVRFVQFIGRLKPEAYKARYDRHKSCIDSAEARKRSDLILTDCSSMYGGEGGWAMTAEFRHAHTATEIEEAASTVTFRFVIDATNDSSFRLEHVELDPWSNVQGFPDNASAQEWVMNYIYK